MATNARYPSSNINPSGAYIFPSYRYHNISFLPWTVQVNETTLSTSQVDLESTLILHKTSSFTLDIEADNRY